ncbi:MAG TPA: lysophospholipase [Clostridium sp.]|nr:lysophospholipase [Clostridium sp.]
MQKMNTKSIFFKIILFLMLFGQAMLNVNWGGIKAYASEENKIMSEIGITEDNYSEKMNNIVMPFIEERLESGYITGEENVQLYYEKYMADSAKGNIVISHGYTESLEKYHEVIYYFLNNGYNVFGLEHRGHGRSTNLGVKDTSQIYVKDFNQYIEDFKTLLDEVVVPNSQGKKLFLFAHSMGGGIGAKFLEDYPEYFNAAILTAPMLEVDTGKVPSFIAKIIVKLAMSFGMDGEYVIGKGPYTPEYDINSMGPSSLPRYEYINDIVCSNELFQKGDCANSWLNEAFNATSEIIKKNNAEKVKIPVVIIQAGKDTYVRPGGQNKFAEVAENCKIIRIENARHEMYNESDDIQKPYFEEIFKFYNENL